MNNQFLTQFLREDQDEVNKSIENVLNQTGADNDLVDMFMNAIRQGLITPEKALEIIKTGFNKDISEDGMGGGSTTGGGVTNGATFTPGNGEQYAMGSKKVSRKKLGEKVDGGEFEVGDKVKHANQDWEIEKILDWGYRLKSVKNLPSVNIDKKVLDRENSGVKTEDAPRLAGEPSKTDKGGARNISAYTKDGFTKAPSAEEAAKTIKGVEVKDLWGKKALEENYYSFRNETKTRGKSDQFHEAVKIINKKLDEVNRLLEFTGTLKTELSESEDTFEIKTNTKKSMDKVRGKVIEAYQKLKQL